MTRLTALILTTFSLVNPAVSHAEACAWVFVRDPANTSPSCEELAYPPRTTDQPFRLVDEVHGLRLEQTLTNGSATAPAGLDRADFAITRPIREWGMRNVAHHLGKMHEFLRRDLGRRFASRALTVKLVNQHIGMGQFTNSSVSLGGYGEVASEVISHEYGHHVVEWERPGITDMRNAGGRVAYGLIEAWANHLAFVLDEEPRFSEYMQGLNHTPQYIYTVETDCTQRRCGQAVFRVDDSYRAVVLFGALLWDLHKQAGARESAGLMLDSLQFIDPRRDTLNYRTAIRALLQADRTLYGSRWQQLLLRQAAARFPDVDIL